ncbi:MAG: DNA repair protein RecN [Clostridia bacterium]|nr:DNA repair protein RecN [Clostridia bacterium]
MLTELNIENVAVIERAAIRFDAGLNVLTGETGAGKSIVIDAINAVLGARTSKDVVRTGARDARVSAFFDAVPDTAAALLRDFDLEIDAADGLLLSRTLTHDGRSVCRVNGQPVTAAMLRQLGTLLITICGQHDSQRLLQRECHLDYVDRLADCGELLAQYRETYQKLKQTRRQLSALQQSDRDKQNRLDFLSFQIRELEDADLRIGEWEELNAEKRKLQNKEKIERALIDAASAIDGDETGGILSQLYTLCGALSRLSDADDAFTAYRDEAENFRYLMEDCLSTVHASLDDAPQIDIDTVEARLDVLYRLSKKYGATEEEMLSFLDSARAQYEDIAFADERKAALQVECAALENAVFQQGCHISDCRKKAAAAFADAVRNELTQLDMPGAEFVVDFRDRDPDETGLDEVEFLFSANVGQPARPLAKIASGGELSRVMLAIRCVLSQANEETMIFDEIDTGVSGRAAGKIARKLRQVAHGRQVICVTHLAQIAAAGDRHLLIEKSAAGDATYTSVTPLTGDAREMELARIIGGDVVTQSTLSSARELMEYAAQNPPDRS